MNATKDSRAKEIISHAEAGAPLNVTVQELTDSIMSVYGDMEATGWAEYVACIQGLFGSHPIGAAHKEIVPDAVALRFYRMFNCAPFIQATDSPRGAFVTPSTPDGI